MADLQGRKIFKVFNQDFIVDERYTVTKELGQGAYGIVWYEHLPAPFSPGPRRPRIALNLGAWELGDPETQRPILLDARTPD